MHPDIINISLAFIEGFALIVSPCILPILPIVLTGSLTGNKGRPVGIIIGFVISFSLVTLFSRALIEHAHLNPDLLRDFSYIILILVGIIIFSDTLSEKFTHLTSRLANIGSSLTYANNPQSGLLGGILFGLFIGIIWTPCAGPILAAVIVQVVVQKTQFSSILTVIAFAIGAGVPMLIIAILGRSVMSKFSFFRNRTVVFRKILGLLIISSVIFAIYGVTLTLSYGQDSNEQSTQLTLKNKLEKPYPAPALAGIDAWINSKPLQWSDLKGKVVLVDFWTYSCINCIRTLPYLKDWYAKYHDQGFVIIGVHSPEFQFEHDFANVKAAVAKAGILYPVAVDNQFSTWQNFHNEYWPAHYLIDKEGNVVYQHFGEGEYDVTENNIRYLLGITTPVAAKNASEGYSAGQTPETYFGYARAASYAGVEPIMNDLATVYSYPTSLAQNQWALKGKWIVSADKIVSASAGAAVKLHYRATNVYAVMGMTGKSIAVKVMLNGELLEENKGDEVVNSVVTVNQNKLYTIIHGQEESDGILEFISLAPGLELYTFTFG